MKIGPIEITAKDTSAKFFVDQTLESYRWFIVEEAHRAEWNAWRQLPEDDEKAMSDPPYARFLPDGPCRVTFQHPDFF